ncbi:MAG: hypothetical protein HEP71_25155 [Roseivirga sp.]|nr:hypothetical protein [Roseivirga sp.]
MHVKKSALLLGLCIISLSLSARQNPKSYIVLSQSDTINGLVKHKPANGKEVYLHTSKGKTLYTPNTVLGFRTPSGREYISLNLSGIDGFDGNSFVEKLVIGQKMSLYKTREGFVIEKEGKLTYLSKGLEKEDIKTLVNNFRKVAELTGDCSKPLLGHKRFRLNINTMTRIVSDYNGCMNSSYNIFGFIPELFSKGSIAIDFTAGMNISKLSFNGDLNKFRFTRNSDFDMTLAPLIGVELRSRSARLGNSVGFIAGMSLNRASYGSRATWEPPGFFEENTIDIEVWNARVLIGFTYALGISSKKLFTLNAGLSFDQGLGLKAQSTRYTRTELSPTVVDENTEINDSPFETASGAGIWAEFGIKKPISKHLPFGVFIRYNQSEGILNATTRLNDFQIVLKF